MRAKEREGHGLHEAPELGSIGRTELVHLLKQLDGKASADCVVTESRERVLERYALLAAAPQRRSEVVDLSSGQLRLSRELLLHEPDPCAGPRGRAGSPLALKQPLDGLHRVSTHSTCAEVGVCDAWPQSHAVGERELG